MRLGVKPANDPNIVQTLEVVDSKAIVGPFSTLPNELQKKGLGVDTPNGTFWHRFNFDGYGEQHDGGPWDIRFPTCDTLPDTCLQNQKTVGRAWPIFAGERGEYELAAGGSTAAVSATEHLKSIANTGNDGYMLPEQVWDENPPSGQPGSRRERAPSRPHRSPGPTLSLCALHGPYRKVSQSSDPRSCTITTFQVPLRRVARPAKMIVER